MGKKFGLKDHQSPSRAKPLHLEAPCVVLLHTFTSFIGSKIMLVCTLSECEDLCPSAIPQATNKKSLKDRTACCDVKGLMKQCK